MQPEPNNRTWKYRLMVADGEAEYLIASGDSATIIDALDAAEIIAKLASGCHPSPVGPSPNPGRRPDKSTAPGGLPRDPETVKTSLGEPYAHGPRHMAHFLTDGTSVCFGSRRRDETWPDYRNRVRQQLNDCLGNTIYQEIQRELLADGGVRGDSPPVCPSDIAHVSAQGVSKWSV